MSLQAYLKDQGVLSAVYYRKLMHRQGAYAYLGLNDEHYPGSLKLDRKWRHASLPERKRGGAGLCGGEKIFGRLMRV